MTMIRLLPRKVLRKVLRKVFSQNQNVVSSHWGAFKQSASQIGIYVTMINTVMLAVTLYSTGWLQENIANVRFIPFMAIVFGLIGALLLFAWKMDMPSFFSSWSDQFWRHNNPMRKYLDEKFDAIDDRLKKLEGLAGEEEKK